MKTDIEMVGLEEPNWGPFGEDIFKRTYSRTKADGSKETWAETCKRVIEGNCNFVDSQYIEDDEPQKLFDLMYNFKLIPAGRHIKVTGIKGRQQVFNCWVNCFSDDPAEHFTFLFARLLEGGGVGCDYSNEVISRYEYVPKTKCEVHFVCDEDHRDYAKLQDCLCEDYSSDWVGSIVVEDSREGWVDVLRLIIDSFYGSTGSCERKNGHFTNVLVIDVSHVRPEGSKLKTFGGIASGPKALVLMLKAVVNKLNQCYDEITSGEKTFLSSLDFMEIDHEISKCVIAGGVRRSARLCTKYWGDNDIFEFIACKKSSTAHWSSNISVTVDSDFWEGVTCGYAQEIEILDAIVTGMLENGEPGIFNIEKCNGGELEPIFSANACGEIPGQQKTSCVLGSIPLCKYVKNNFEGERESGFVLEQDLLESFRLMTRFLIRATFSEYKDDGAKERAYRDRRIGVGLTGFADFMTKMGYKYSDYPEIPDLRQFLFDCYVAVQEEAREYAYALRIPEPVKVTAIAPTGTISKLAGVSEGMQPTLFKYYKRRVNYTVADEQQMEIVRQAEVLGLDVETSVYNENTVVVSYLCKEPVLNEILDETVVQEASDLTPEECLAVQEALQDDFVDNAISYTINVNSDLDKQVLQDAIEKYGPYLKGITVCPFVTNRPQMPYERISKKEYEDSVVKFVEGGVLVCKNDVCKLPGVEDEE